MSKTKEEIREDELNSVSSGLAGYGSLEKDVCFDDCNGHRYVLVYDYPDIKSDTNFLVDIYAYTRGNWERIYQTTIAQSKLFGYSCIGKWRP